MQPLYWRLNGISWALRYWDVKYYDGHTERLNERGLREYGPPRTRCAQEPSPSEQAITGYLSVRSPGAKDWYMAEGIGFAPYQQRQMAQLATCSDYAVCRGKRGAPEHQLCPCGQRKRENTEHAVLECPLYEGLRGPLDRTMREHTALVLDRFGPSPVGLPLPCRLSAKGGEGKCSNYRVAPTPCRT